MKTKTTIQNHTQLAYQQDVKDANIQFNRKYVKLFTTVIAHMDRLGKF